MSDAAATSETGCCARFDPEPWDGREVTWREKLFLRDRVRSFFCIPLGFGRVMMRCMGRISEAGAADDPTIVLCDHASPWRTEVWISVSREVEGARLERLSGAFFARAFEGPYRDAGRWAKSLRGELAAKGEEPSEILFWYTTCPRCAKAYGANWTVLLARR